MSVYTVILANIGKEGLYLVYLYGGQKAFLLFAKCAVHFIYYNFTGRSKKGVVIYTWTLWCFWLKLLLMLRKSDLFQACCRENKIHYFRDRISMLVITECVVFNSSYAWDLEKILIHCLHKWKAFLNNWQCVGVGKCVWRLKLLHVCEVFAMLFALSITDINTAQYQYSTRWIKLCI